MGASTHLLRARRRVLFTMLLGAASGALIAADALADNAAARAPSAAVVAPAAVAVPSFDALLTRQGQLDAKLKPDVKKRLDAAGRELVTRLARPAATGARAKTVLENAQDTARSYPDLGALAGGDIQALAFLVLMEAAKSAQDDLKGILDSVKAISRSRTDLRAALEKRKANQDGGADLGAVTQAQSLAMMVQLDRLQKFEETLSNVLKQVSDTQSTVIGNLK